MPTIEYFYSAHSSYAYLGSARLAGIAANKSSDIVHRPIDLNQIVAAAGSTAFGERSDAYRAYFFVRELQRWSEYRNVPIISYPQYHHHDTTLANCMIISCAETGGNTQELSNGLLQAHWRDDADLADDATLLDIATSAGCDHQSCDLSRAPDPTPWRRRSRPNRNLSTLPRAHQCQCHHSLLDAKTRL